MNKLFILGAAVVIGLGLLFYFQKGSVPLPAQENMENNGAASSTLDGTTSEAWNGVGNTYENGILPLGDKKYTTAGPKKGYIYLCNVPNAGRGAQADGPWINGTTWSSDEKIAVQGSVTWPNASFSITKEGEERVITGNDLPINHSTGKFPIQSTDPAYQYDRNPNSISTQNIALRLPAAPVLTSAPSCMGMEVGVMLTGIPLLNGFDAELRDAVAHEVQDSCEGHPQEAGQYHYHGPSSCISDQNVSTVIGFALDGLPITGGKVGEDKYLTTNDLDECHGITSTIILDGKETKTYHYVMTQDFPYSVSCFRAKPVSLQVISKSQSNSQNTASSQSSQTPPTAALSACTTKSNGAVCSFATAQGTVSGTCKVPPGTTTLACVP